MEIVTVTAQRPMQLHPRPSRHGFVLSHSSSIWPYKELGDALTDGVITILGNALTVSPDADSICVLPPLSGALGDILADALGKEFIELLADPLTDSVNRGVTHFPSFRTHATCCPAFGGTVSTGRYIGRSIPQSPTSHISKPPPKAHRQSGMQIIRKENFSFC